MKISDNILGHTTQPDIQVSSLLQHFDCTYRGHCKGRGIVIAISDCKDNCSICSQTISFHVGRFHFQRILRVFLLAEINGFKPISILYVETFLLQITGVDQFN